MWRRLFKKAHPATYAVTHYILESGRAWTPSAFTETQNINLRFNSRFEAFSLPMVMVLHYLKETHPTLAQDVHDRVFAEFDGAMREEAIGDMSVGTKIKKMAQALRGRIARYVPLMEADSVKELAAAIHANTQWDDVCCRKSAQAMLKQWKALPVEREKWLEALEKAYTNEQKKSA